MLIKLSVDNFMSFENETELTMIPSNKTTKKNDHKIKVKSTPLLKYGVVYGANAAGKSNLVEVFKFIQYSVKHSLPAKSSTMFCKTKQENAQRSSNFEIQFTLNEKFYAYGFCASLQKCKIESEWLYELYQNGSSKQLFEREIGSKPRLGDTITLNNLDTLKMKTYLDDFDENSNILFLSFMNRGKRYNEDSKLIFFKKIWYNIICQFKEFGTFFYCNIASPYVIEYNTIKYIDYDLDLRVFPDYSYKILDKNEYIYHKKIYNYDSILDKIIKKELSKLIEMQKSNKFPFEIKEIYKYLKKFKEIERRKKP